jgi:hypothetical protein
MSASTVHHSFPQFSTVHGSCPSPSPRHTTTVFLWGVGSVWWKPWALLAGLPQSTLFHSSKPEGAAA